jgi:hypothetical protein
LLQLQRQCVSTGCFEFLSCLDYTFADVRFGSLADLWTDSS